MQEFYLDHDDFTISETKLKSSDAYYRFIITQTSKYYYCWWYKSNTDDYSSYCG
jgi:hypothetical protein